MHLPTALWWGANKHKSCNKAGKKKYTVPQSHLTQAEQLFYERRSYVHLHTSNNSHYEWVRNGRFNMKWLLIQGFQFLVIFLCCVHLNFQSINLQQLCALLQVILSIICLQSLIQNNHFLDNCCHIYDTSYIQEHKYQHINSSKLWTCVWERASFNSKMIRSHSVNKQAATNLAWKHPYAYAKNNDKLSLLPDRTGEVA